MSKPGVMFYFDVRPCLKRLNVEEKGKLFEAILDYGEYGTIPDFSDVLGVAWDFVQQKIDVDNSRYEAIVEKRKIAATTRWNKNTDAIASFCMQDMQDMQDMPDAITKANTEANTKANTKERMIDVFQRHKPL